MCVGGSDATFSCVRVSRHAPSMHVTKAAWRAINHLPEHSICVLQSHNIQKHTSCDQSSCERDDTQESRVKPSPTKLRAEYARRPRELFTSGIRNHPQTAAQSKDQTMPSPQSPIQPESPTKKAKIGQHMRGNRPAVLFLFAFLIPLFTHLSPHHVLVISCLLDESTVPPYLLYSSTAGHLQLKSSQHGRL